MRRLIVLGALLAGAALLVRGIMLREQQAEPGQRMLPREREHEIIYVALGDSTVYGMGASRPARNYVSRLASRLRSIYPRVQTTNLGLNGATAADVVQRQLARAVAAQPHLVTLSIGPNDIIQGRDVATYESDLAMIFRTLDQETQAVVVVNLLPDLAVTPLLNAQQRMLVSDLVIRFNDAVHRQAQQYDAEIVDLYAPSQQEVPRQPQLLAEDYYHPSDEGYTRWAEVMWQGVARRIP